MARMPHREVMSAAEAKARLLALDGSPSRACSLLSSPTVRAGALLLGAVVVGTTLGSRSRSGMLRSLRRVGVRAAGIFGPVLMQQFARDLAHVGASRAGAHAR